MNTWDLSICLFVLGLVPSLAGADVPFETYPIDHGYRYHIDDDTNRGCALAVGPDRVLAVYGIDGGEELYGKQRGLLGEEIEVNPVRIRAEDDFVAYVDLSDFDGIGYKLAYTVRNTNYGPGGLYVRNLDPETLDDTDSLVVVREGGVKVYYPTLHFTGDYHVLAWTHEEDGARDLRLMAFYPDFTIAVEPFVVAEDVSAATIGFASGKTEHFIAWIDNGRDLYVRRLQPDLTPWDQPRLIATDAATHVDIATHGDDYLLAYMGADIYASPYYALLDFTGYVLSGPHWIPDDGYYGITVSPLVDDPASPMGFVAWRGIDLGPRGARISSDGELLDTIELASEFGAFDIFVTYDDMRNIDSKALGGSVAVVWNSQSGPEILAGRSWPDNPVGGQYVDPDGETFFDPWWHVNTGTSPRDACVTHVDGDYRVFIQDRFGGEYLHRVDIDTTGNWLDRAGYATDWGEIVAGEAKARPWRNGSAVIYHVRYGYDNEEHNYVEWQIVYVDLVNDEAEVERIAFEVGGGPYQDYRLDSWDVCTKSDSILIAYAGGTWNTPSDLFLRLYQEPSDLLSQWRVPGDWHSRQPTLIGLEDDYLVVWADERDGESLLYYIVLDPGTSGDVVGSPFIETGEIQDVPWLVEGPGQRLCVFRQTIPGSPSDRGIFALRLDRNGVPVDLEPIFIGPTESSGLPRAIWDGVNYLVTWIGSPNLIHANRMTSDGDVLDGDGFEVISGPGAGDLATDGNGTVAVVCSGSGIAYLHDGGASGVGSGGLPGPSLSSAFPNPSSGAVFLRLGEAVPRRLDVLDPTGRRVLSRLGPRVDARGVLRWDGRLSGGAAAPAGVYYMRLVTDRGVSSRTVTLIR